MGRSTANSSPDSPRRWLHLSEVPCWWALWGQPRPSSTAWTHRGPDPFLSGPISWEDIWSDQMSKMMSQEFYYLKLMAHILSCWASGLCYLSAAKSTLPNFSLSLPIHPQVWFTLGQHHLRASSPSTCHELLSNSWDTDWNAAMQVKIYRCTCYISWNICSVLLLAAENKAMIKHRSLDSMRACKYN